MPHYFFYLAFGDRLVPDEEGVELAGRWSGRFPGMWSFYRARVRGVVSDAPEQADISVR